MIPDAGILILFNSDKTQTGRLQDLRLVLDLVIDFQQDDVLRVAFAPHCPHKAVFAGPFLVPESRLGGIRFDQVALHFFLPETVAIAGRDPSQRVAAVGEHEPHPPIPEQVGYLLTADGPSSPYLGVPCMLQSSVSGNPVTTRCSGRMAWPP